MGDRGPTRVCQMGTWIHMRDLWVTQLGKQMGAGGGGRGRRGGVCVWAGLGRGGAVQGAGRIGPPAHFARSPGTAGVMISLSRILTKLLLPDECASTLIFFLVSVALELLCFLLHLLVRRSRFVLFYTTRPRDSRWGRPGPGRGSGYRVHHDVVAGDVHFEHPAPALAPDGSPKDSPAHEVTSSSGAYMRFHVPWPRVQRSWPTFRALFLHHYVVAWVIWADMLPIAVTYFMTLCLFPGLESEIRHCILGEWLPILIMAVFNLSDFVGKILAALPVDWQGTHLLACSCLRVVFIPLFILCVYPSGMPALRHPAWPCIFSLLMVISNGYFGSVPMILAAGKVSPEQRELAGNTMTVSYMSGLTLGSAVAYCTYSLTRDAHGSCLHASTANGSILAGL
ncbi:equilibrative nucleoside transporter 4-like [Pan paniscus]|uniref:equilibrative nucleoside transporter 4-like n=2 Tax=Pan paniscus TaxID=9597 RepID=UPI0024370594|nr:equilibrative nucleoside transporter 4-like [Pan paniscus]